MKMVDRAKKIAAGDYKSREEATKAREERAAKKNDWSWSSKGVWASSWGGGWGTTSDGDASIDNDELAELYFQNKLSA